MTVPRLVGQPLFGRTVDSDRVDGPVLGVAMRYAGSAWTRTAVRALDAFVFDEIDRRQGLIVGVVEGGLEAARDLAARHRVRFPLLFDADGSLHESMGSRRDPRGLLRIGPRRAFHRSMASHYEPGALSGPLDRLPVAFLTHRGETIWSWAARGVCDPIPVEEIAREVHRLDRAAALR